MSGPDERELAPRPPLLHRITRRQLLLIDWMIAIILIGSAMPLAFGNGGRHHSWTIIGLAIVAGLAIVLRRRAPMTALALVTLTLGTAAATGQDWAPDPLIAIPMYQVTSVSDRRRSLSALGAACAGLLTAAVIGSLAHHPVATAALDVFVATTAWFFGDSVRVRRVYVAGLADQADQRQREAIERAQRSVAEERLQIARELHDVVAHSLSVIAVQSGVGRHVIDDQPDEAKKALAAVEATSRGALDELRRMLGVLRSDDGAPASLAPAPDVRALDSLIEQVRGAGFDVEFAMHSTIVGSLAPTVELSIYRIVQEALTNVVKHAGPASVRVELRDEPGALVVEITDDGVGERPRSDRSLVGVSEVHHGIVGMHERVALFEGSFSAGTGPEGGFRVRATFPLEHATAS